MQRCALVIDDNRLVANNLARMLEMLGYNARPLYGAPAAIQALTVQIPDVILLDIHMQTINGIELCRYIRSQPAMNKVYIIGISSDTQSEMVAAMRAAGANAFISKPLTLEALEAVLYDWEHPPTPDDHTRLLSN